MPIPKPARGLSPRVRGSRRIPDVPPDLRGPIPAGAGEPRPVPRAARRGAAYPRGCGGASPPTSPETSCRGLSPRVRGSRTGKNCERIRDRPIPAGAGEPGPGSISVQHPPAYPRGCGGATRLSVETVLARGLSPRVRGSPRLPDARGRGQRPIPAGAGEPAVAASERHLTAAYPRGCGGAGMAAIVATPSKGLSPRVRGSPSPDAAHPLLQRPIPAGAGEPPLDSHGIAPPAAYPRGCGGALPLLTALLPQRGLSPRVRGSHFPHYRPTDRGGPIPAGAGEPVVRCRRAGGRMAYPRGCGGAVTPLPVGAGVDGLSPRVRGSRHRGWRGHQGWRPIPAGAGEPIGTRRTISARRAYPRGCGGARLRGMWSQAGMGLSPRVRGSLAAVDLRRLTRWPIPAGAGEPSATSSGLSATRAYPRGCGGASRSCW